MVEGLKKQFPLGTCEKSEWTDEYRLGRVQKNRPLVSFNVQNRHPYFEHVCENGDDFRQQKQY